MTEVSGSPIMVGVGNRVDTVNMWSEVRSPNGYCLTFGPAIRNTGYTVEWQSCNHRCISIYTYMYFYSNTIPSSLLRVLVL